VAWLYRSFASRLIGVFLPCTVHSDDVCVQEPRRVALLGPKPTEDIRKTAYYPATTCCMRHFWSFNIHVLAIEI